ncbi:MAG TPA: PilZ domain-containing protein [Geobacteraceae bacterium]|nr:PilZ domain-containing protein [Geobacteraceae bacterium]
MEARRKFSRIKCKMNARVQIDNLLIIDATITNISLKGAFFELADHCVFREGDKWHLKIRLPNSDISLNFRSEVIHASKKLVGVKFLHMDIDTMFHLRSLMEGRTSDPEKVESEVELLYE